MPEPVTPRGLQWLIAEGVQPGDDEPGGMLGDRGIHPGECALADLAHNDLDPHVGVPRRSEDLRIIRSGGSALALIHGAAPNGCAARTALSSPLPGRRAPFA